MIEFLKDFGLVLLICKSLGILSKRLGAPQVVGEIIGGLILGPCVLDVIESGDTISLFAEIGVLMMMFSTGLGTDLKQLMKSGKTAFMIALVGVLVPLLGGTLLYSCFYGFASIGSKEFYSAIFIGTIMTATSVSITVATLQELGKINTKLGTVIVSAAIIDDVIGMIVLTCVVGAASGEKGSFGVILIKTILFFAIAWIVGYLANRGMEFLDKKYPHTQRIPIFSLAICFLMAYMAEKYFGIADITGAYIMGVALASVDDAKYIEKKVDISAYMIFAPVFFANIGLQTNLKSMTKDMLVFSALFVLVALICKILGCGIVARLSGFDTKDALKVGIGMMTRGEVALIVAQKGLSIGLIDSAFFSAVILLIIVSSIATPLLLKYMYRENSKKG
ncbi:MAG: cation:proton antiporter [bacterium]|nr:cation:proton antiporter [bacterium]